MMLLIRNLFGRAEPVLGEAGPRDAAAISALHGKSFRRGWSEPEVEAMLLERNVFALRAMRGNKLAGFIISRLAGDEAEILSVAVDRGFRGRGLSRRMLNLHMRRLAGLGAHAVFLEVDENNAPANRLYARAGFHEVARRQNYYQDASGKNSAALVLRRDLG